MKERRPQAQLRHGDFRRHLEAAGLPSLRFQDPRHTAAVMMLNNGVPINLVSQIPGHKDPAMSPRRCARGLSGAQQIVAEKFDAYGF